MEYTPIDHIPRHDGRKAVAMHDAGHAVVARIYGRNVLLPLIDYPVEKSGKTLIQEMALSLNDDDKLELE